MTVLDHFPLWLWIIGLIKRTLTRSSPALALLINDLLATGGTAAAAAELIGKHGGRILAINFLIELKFLNGREKLKGHAVHSIIIY